MKSARSFGIGSILFAAVCLQATAADAAPVSCNEPGGTPQVVDGTLQCSVGTSITTAGSKTLLEATFGLVREVQIASTLRLPMGLDDLLRLLGERMLTVPPQDVQIRVLFKDGKELPISLTLAPVVNLEGTTLCDLQATGAALNLTRFESPLPDWIDATVARLINENQDARDQLRDALQTTLSNARPSFCR